MDNGLTVAGVDVGGKRKGFHVAALTGSDFRRETFTRPVDVVQWCRSVEAVVVAVDAPCGWSSSGLSRKAERDLKIAGQKIHCFATPTEARARAHDKGFYDWVFNGMDLYAELIKNQYALYGSEASAGLHCFETFPQAIACALAGEIVPARRKAAVRRKVLAERGYDPGSLSNIDYIDAGLCAVAAGYVLRNRFTAAGQPGEGCILMPQTAE